MRCTWSHRSLSKRPHVSPKSSEKQSKRHELGEGRPDAAGHVSSSLQPHPFTAGGCSRGELGGRAQWEQGAGVGNAPPTIWGATGGREPPMCHPDPPQSSAQPMVCSYAGNRHSWVKKHKNRVLRNRRDFCSKVRSKAESILTCKTCAGCSSPSQPTRPTLSLRPRKPHAEPWACPLPQSQAGSQAGLPWPTRHKQQPPAHDLPQPLGRHLGSSLLSTPLVFVARLSPQVREQQTQHRL